MLNAAEAAYWLDYQFTLEPEKEPEMPETPAPRYVPAFASYVEADGLAYGPLWGVRDTVADAFAPFGGNEALATEAAKAIAAAPEGYAFTPDYVLAEAK